MENANCLLVFIGKNLTNSMLSPGLAVGRELCPAAAAGQREGDCRAAEPYLAIKFSCHLAFFFFL